MVVAIKNFQRMIQSIMKSCFGSIARGSLNFWIGSTTNEPEESDRRCCRSQRILDVFVAFMPTGESSSHKMPAVRRITEVKRDNLPFRIRLAHGREFSVDSGGSVEIEPMCVAGKQSYFTSNARRDPFVVPPPSGSSGRR